MDVDWVGLVIQAKGVRDYCGWGHQGSLMNFPCISCHLSFMHLYPKGPRHHIFIQHLLSTQWVPGPVIVDMNKRMSKTWISRMNKLLYQNFSTFLHLSPENFTFLLFLIIINVFHISLTQSPRKKSK